MNAWIYSSIIVLTLATGTAGVSSARAEEKADSAKCRAAELQRQVDEMKKQIDEMKKQVDEMKKLISGPAVKKAKS